jgi:hypothetical protein
MSKPLVLIGAGEFAQIACEYFEHDSDYDVVAFSVEREYLAQPLLAIAPWWPTRHWKRITRRRMSTCLSRFPPASSIACARAFTWTKRRGLPVCHVRQYARFRVAQRRTGRKQLHLRRQRHPALRSHRQQLHSVERQSRGASHGRARQRIRRLARSYFGYCDIGESSFIGVNATFNDHVKSRPTM